MSLAPVVLFVYNRPLHTEQTLNALIRNDLADETTLYVYCDGPKEGATENDLNNISKVREVINKKKWCKHVHSIEHDTNQGLARNILTGVTEILDRHGKVIVLEDDIVTSKTFLEYMNFSLEYYKEEKRIFHINGFSNHSNLQWILDDYYFLRFMYCWGWATWKDRWDLLDKDYKSNYNKFIANKELLYQFNYGDIMRFQDQLLDNINHKSETWAVLWNCTIFFNKGLCLTSKRSYVVNVGLDGTGENCVPTNIYNNTLNNEIKPFRGNIQINEKFKSKVYLQLFFEYGKNFNFLKFLKKSIVKKIKI